MPLFGNEKESDGTERVHRPEVYSTAHSMCYRCVIALACSKLQLQSANNRQRACCNSDSDLSKLSHPKETLQKDFLMAQTANPKN